MNSNDLRVLCGRGIAALATLRDCRTGSTPIFLRDANHVERAGRVELDPHARFPTATAHAVLALLDVGAHAPRQYSTLTEEEKKGVFALDDWTHSHVPVKRGRETPSFPHLSYCLQHHLDAGKHRDAKSYADSPWRWLTNSLSWSVHSSSSSRLDELVFFGHFVPAMAFLAEHVERSGGNSKEPRVKLTRGFELAIVRVGRILGYPRPVYGKDIPTIDLDRSAIHPKMPPHVRPETNKDVVGGMVQAPLEAIPTYLLLNAAFALESVLKYAKNNDTRVAFSRAVGAFRARRIGYAKLIARDLVHCFRRRVERFMAARDIADDVTFDPIGLVLAMRGAILLDTGFRESPLCRAAVETLVASQLKDGCWPDGASTNAEAGKATQQPSVEVAFHLVASIYSRKSGSNPTEAELALMNAALPAIQRHARYLELTMIEHAARVGTVSGWPSDRARSLGNPETWITALAIRFLHFSALVVDAVERAKILRKYGHVFVRRRPVEPASATIDPETTFKNTVIEPEPHTTPRETVLSMIIKSIAGKMREGRYVTRPNTTGVSFLLFGPPRSGKTYLVEMLAKSLDWPLVKFDPGHFIQQGGESIGAMAARVFEDIERLHNSVVLFDECDELILQRSPTESDAKSGPIFVTGSMLTRLARLHDARACVFVFATNYYHLVDRAARGAGRFDAVVLFDRPDADARKTHLMNEWNKRVQKQVAMLGRAGASIADANSEPMKVLSELSDGASFLEMSDLVRELFKNQTLLSRVASDPKETQKSDELKELVQKTIRSRLEYLTWCAGDGIVDIAAAEGPKFSPQTKGKLVSDWIRTAKRHSPENADKIRNLAKKHGITLDSDVNA
ncbi:MAG: ATP-binding protein [Phycisphaeraceae bacterium]|nr:ATP-binding protein [Phycisphaeraceae bacterium]